LDSQDRAAFEDIEFSIVYAFGNILQKPWLPLTAGVIRGKMIIDIDDQKSVQDAMERISKDWFDPAKMYVGLKAAGKTDSSGFWHIASNMLADVSSSLGWATAQFLKHWKAQWGRAKL